MILFHTYFGFGHITLAELREYGAEKSTKEKKGLKIPRVTSVVPSYCVTFITSNTINTNHRHRYLYSDCMYFPVLHCPCHYHKLFPTYPLHLQIRIRHYTMEM